MRPTRCRWCRTKSLAERGKRCWGAAQFRVTIESDPAIYYVCAPHLLAAVRVERRAVVSFKHGNPSSYTPRVLRKHGWPVAERTWKEKIRAEDKERAARRRRLKAKREANAPGCPSVHRATGLRCTRAFHLGGMHEAWGAERKGMMCKSVIRWGRAGEKKPTSWKPSRGRS